MEAKIEINCESYSELLMHLNQISIAIRNKQDELMEEKSISIEDYNCYGDHKIEIEWK